MKIPKSINVAGHQIKIVYKNKLQSDGVPCVGLAYLTEDRIELARTCHGAKLSPDQRATAFLHEAIHVMSTLHSLKFTEKEVTALELALYQLLKDNKLRF